MRTPSIIRTPLIILAALACSRGQANNVSADSAHTMDHAPSTSAEVTVPNDSSLPADPAHALARLNASPRHGEYVMLPVKGSDSLRAWIEYPTRSTKAPVVVVIHEIFGMSSWVRAVADQLAASGYIAIVPDFLTKQNLPGAPDSVPMQAGMAAVSALNMDDVQHGIDAAATYGMSLPAAQPKYAVIGFCWGGGVAFAHAVHSPSLKAAVVYYGTSPKSEALTSITAPILGLYGQNDARVVTTIAPADSTMKKLGKTFEPHIYDGAEHGFLRAQSGANGANLKATQQAWPTTLNWLHKYLGA